MDCVEERPTSTVNVNVSEQRSDEGKDEATTLTVRRPLRRQCFGAPRSTPRAPPGDVLPPSPPVRLRVDDSRAGTTTLPRRTARSFVVWKRRGHRRVH